MKKIIHILPFLIIFLTPTLSWSTEVNHDAMKAALFGIAKQIDTVIIDKAIITGCSLAGYNIGRLVNLWFLEQVCTYNSYYYHSSSISDASTGCYDLYRGKYSVHNNLPNRYDDDFGQWIGLCVGGEIGTFVVALRHKITDPLFPALYNLSVATVKATKVQTENVVGWVSNTLCGKINGATTYFNSYQRK